MLEHQVFRQPGPGEPMVLAAFSYRYDAHLVPGLIENIRPGVHGFVAWDDRSATAALSDEPTRRALLFRTARELGARWLLTPDPDERLEQGFSAWLPGLMAEGDRTVWNFDTREMWDATHMRTDGPWGGKKKVIFFPIDAAKVDPAALLHAPRVGDAQGFRKRDARINLYHLRMATPERRQLRRDLYAAADPERKFQAIGYDYLVDERGMVLEPIPEGRGFRPPFVEDHALWSPDPGALGEIRPDPYEVRFARAANAARRRGQRAAHHVMDDLFRASPQDADLRLLTARFAVEAREHDAALALADQALSRRPADLYPRLLRASALTGLGRSGEAEADLSALRHAVPGSPMIADLCARAERPRADFLSATAPWRRLAPEDAVVREGSAIARSDLATVVIGFRNQPGLLSAVQSLLQQDEVPEIVVVNSGGGTVEASLAPVLGQIRLIACEVPVQVGAARNIGVAASRAPFVAFLAGDCLARPGWVSGRLSRHRAGALTVSSAVIGQENGGPVALAANRLHYSTRDPQADPRTVLHFGLSYTRHLLDLCGIFPPGLSATEDSVLNRQALRFANPVWAPDVVTVHRDVTSLLALMQDERRRGQRRAGHAPCRPLRAEADPAQALLPAMQRRLRLGGERLLHDPGLSGAERRASLASLWLAAMADRHGVLEGLARVRAADDLLEEARRLADKPDAALARAEAAWDLDPQDPAKARQVGTFRREAGDRTGAVAAFRAALALDPADTAAARDLVALVARRDGPLAAWAEAERCALNAPLIRQHWDLAADCARLAGLGHWAVALGQIALGCAVDVPQAHTRLATLYGSLPDPLMMAFRSLTAKRLAAVAEARRAQATSSGATG
jgi:tetratricopeptide (TPR) repeat protein